MSRCCSVLLGLLATTLLCAHMAHASQYGNNMFLNGQYQNGIADSGARGSGFSINPRANIFLEHAIISRQASAFMAPTYLPPKCGQGEQCVRKTVCQNGVFTQQQPQIEPCNPDTDVCCRYRPPPPPTPPRTTTTTQRPYVTCNRDSDCVSPRDCRSGEIVANNYVKQQTPSRCFEPQVCCRMPSTTLTEEGYIIRTPENPLTPPPRFEPNYSTESTNLVTVVYTAPTTRPTPSNGYLPPSTTPSYRPVNTTPRVPQTTQPRTPPPQRYTTTPRPPQPTEPRTPPPQRYTTTPRAPQPTQPRTPAPTQARTPPPVRYTTTPRPAPTQRTTPALYLPPIPSDHYTPEKTPRPTAERPAPTPSQSRETQPPRYTTKRPTRPPYEPDYEQPSNLVPIRGESNLSPPIFPQIHGTPAKCASALVCTNENYCNAIGVISETPVEITPFRVPTTDCLIEGTNAPGKCCRDPNYVDPWPVNVAGVCAQRNKNTKPQGIKDIDSNFAEIPWQAMILKESSKSLLCGGAIVGDVFVLTSASCVKDVSVKDMRIKAGEWELGSTKEPLPFQLVGVASIDIHPSYDAASGAHDLALIRLEKRLEFATNVQPICISDKDPEPTENCITSGWGKQALKIHEEGAIMHRTKTSATDRATCGAGPDSVCSSTDFDSCEFDIGSGLACGGGSVVLKGIYSAENNCGEGQTVRFVKPDVKWINQAFADRSKPLLLLKRF